MNWSCVDVPESLTYFSNLSFSSWEEIEARCIPWKRQYWAALNQLACECGKKNTISNEKNCRKNAEYDEKNETYFATMHTRREQCSVCILKKKHGHSERITKNVEVHFQRFAIAKIGFSTGAQKIHQNRVLYIDCVQQNRIHLYL